MVKRLSSQNRRAPITAEESGGRRAFKRALSGVQEGVVVRMFRTTRRATNGLGRHREFRRPSSCEEGTKRSGERSAVVKTASTGKMSGE